MAWAQPTVSDAPANGKWATNTTWYTIKTGGGNYLRSDIVQGGGELALTSTARSTDADGLWCIVGNEQDGFTFYNKAKGVNAPLAMYGSEANAYALVAEEPAGTTTFDFTESKKEGDYWCLKEHGSEKNYWNKRSDRLAYWNSTDAVNGWGNSGEGDNGSALLFEEVSIKFFEYAYSEESIDTWYYMTINSNTKSYLYNDGTANVLVADRDAVDDNDKDAYSWAFIGDPSNGFFVKNKKGGYLNAGNSGAVIGENPHTFTLTESSYAENGFFMAGEGKERFNRNGYYKTVVYWSGADAGSTFLVTKRDIEAERRDELKAELAAAITNAEKYAIGEGVGKYTNASSHNLSDITAFYNSITDETSIAEIEENKTKVNELIASLSLNMPESGKYYRIKAVEGWNDDAPYLGSKNSTANTNRAEFVANDDVNTIFYFDGNYLKSYASGVYLANNSDFLGCNGTANSATKIGFCAASNGLLAAYNISFSSGKRWLYVNQENYTDAGGSKGSSNGYCFNLEEVTELPAAKIGEAYYATFADALAAASAMSGDVTVEIYNKVTLNGPLAGSYSSIKFVGKNETAEIYMDVQGYVEAAGKKVAFEGLKLSKSEGGYVTNAGFMNLAFGVFGVTEATYTNCTFENGAYASTGAVTYTGCTFKPSWDRYAFWAYGDADITIDGCTFAAARGIKMYDEGMHKLAAVTVKNSNFSAITDKPAIVLTSGESVTLEGNTYSSTGVFELDLDGNPNGTPVTSDVAPTCKNDNGACGVLVDGKIYTTVAQAAAVATSGSNVTLLHNSAETVEFAYGVNLNKNSFEAAGVTVMQPVAKIGDVEYTSLQAAINAAQAGETITLLRDINLGDITSAVVVKKSITIDGAGYWTITVNSVNDTFNKAIFVPRGPISYAFKNVTIDLKNAASDMAAFGMKYGGTLENVTVKGAFGQAVSLTMAYPVTVANCKFDGATWGVYANASGANVNVTGTTFNTTGAVYLHQYGELVFTDNIIAADSYVETNATVDVSKNYWGGNAPTAAQLKGENIICDTYYTTNTAGVLSGLTANGVAEEPVIKIELDGETYAYGHSKLSLVSKLLGSSTQASAVKITLLDDIALEDGMQIAAYMEYVDELVISPKTVEIDLGGNTLTGFIQINANVTAAIKNGTVNNTNSTYAAFDITGAATLEDLTVKSTTKAFNVVDDATLTVVTGTYCSNPSAYILEGYLINANEDGTFTVAKDTGLAGEGTEAAPFLIKNIADLQKFQASVNAGETKYNAAGLWVALDADIDLAGVENWSPIGTFDYSFDSNFDGKGHKIMNLKMSSAKAANDYAYVGFFGVTANNVIKDLVIENVTVNADGQIVAAAIAYPYYTEVEGITVCGDIAIKGGNYTAGVLAYTRLCTKASNLTVSGNEGSYIIGAKTVGGVIADIQMNKGLVADYSNFAVSGVTITGEMHVGGISGIITQIH